MKKNTILLLAFMVPMLMQAQAKRRPAGAKAATTAKKPAQKATQKVNNNFAIVQFDEWMKHDVFEDENNIYFLGTTYGENTFRAIDKKTGDIRIVVPKKKRARPQICSAGSNGKDVFMRIENKHVLKSVVRAVTVRMSLCASRTRSSCILQLWARTMLSDRRTTTKKSSTFGTIRTSQVSPQS